MVKIKFCGLHTVEDYLTAWKLGVDYAGFVCCSKSSRAITPKEVFDLLQQARKIACKTKEFSEYIEPKTVGLIVDLDRNATLAAIEIAGFDMVQLYDLSFVDDISVPYWAVYRIQNKEDLGVIMEMYKDTANTLQISDQDKTGEYSYTTHTMDICEKKNNIYKKKHFFSGIVLDNYSKIQKGGTGERFDWSLLENFSLKIPYYIAGGINIDNIDSLLAYQPYGVDISSGIETEKGKKNHLLMSNIVEIMRRAHGFF